MVQIQTITELSYWEMFSNTDITHAAWQAAPGAINDELTVHGWRRSGEGLGGAT